MITQRINQIADSVEACDTTALQSAMVRLGRVAMKKVSDLLALEKGAPCDHDQSHRNLP